MVYKIIPKNADISDYYVYFLIGTDYHTDRINFMTTYGKFVLYRQMLTNPELKSMRNYHCQVRLTKICHGKYEYL